MRSPEQIAKDIVNGDQKSKLELEKMYRKTFESMTIEERRIGVAVLSAFEDQWNK